MVEYSITDAKAQCSRLPWVNLKSQYDVLNTLVLLVRVSYHLCGSADLRHELAPLEGFRHVWKVVGDSTISSSTTGTCE